MGRYGTRKSTFNYSTSQVSRKDVCVRSFVRNFAYFDAPTSKFNSGWNATDSSKKGSVRDTVIPCMFVPTNSDYQRRSGGRRFGIELAMGNSALHCEQINFPSKISSSFSEATCNLKFDLHNGHLMISKNFFLTLWTSGMKLAFVKISLIYISGLTSPKVDKPKVLKPVPYCTRLAILRIFLILVLHDAQID